MRRLLLKRSRKRLGCSPLTRGVDRTSGRESSSIFSGSNHASRLFETSRGRRGSTESSTYYGGRTQHHSQQQQQQQQQHTRACSTTTAPTSTGTPGTVHVFPMNYDDDDDGTNTIQTGAAALQWRLGRLENNSSLSSSTRAQLQHRRQFHATRRDEIIPYLVVGGVVTYFFSKWILDYRAAKEAGGLDGEENEEDEDDDDDGHGSTKKRRGKRVVINADGVAGLDLGSVYSRVGVALADEKDAAGDNDDDDYDSDDDDGTPKNWGVRVVENAEGSRSTVSLVGLQPGEEEFVVGDKAKNLITSNFWASHRLLGCKYDDQEVDSFSSHFKIKDKLIKGIGGTMQITVDDTDHGKASPEMLTSKVIQHLTDLASLHVPSGKCSHILIAVPNDVVDNELACTSFDISMKQAGVQSLGVEKQSLCAIHGKAWLLAGFNH